MFFIGRQVNGSRFLDRRGGEAWDQPGDTGMIDWGAFTPNGKPGARGLDALRGGESRGQSMARTLGSDPNQVAVAGRRTIVGWVSGLWSAQSLPQDLSIGEDGQLRQAFVPELQSLRVGGGVELSASSTDIGQQFEATVQIPAEDRGEAGMAVLKDADSETLIGVDFDRELVFVDATKQGNNVRRAGPLLGHSPGQPILAHVYVDHSLVAVIFNNQTSLTVVAKPSSAAASGTAVYGTGVKATAWKLATANPNDHAEKESALQASSGPSAWQVPKIHNVPACLRRGWEQDDFAKAASDLPLQTLV